VRLAITWEDHSAVDGIMGLPPLSDKVAIEMLTELVGRPSSWARFCIDEMAFFATNGKAVCE